jgi:hypothetical protein
MENYIVKLDDNSECYYSERSENLDVFMNFYNSNDILLSTYHIDTTYLGDMFGRECCDEKLVLLNDFTDCLINGKNGKLDFYYCEGENSIEIANDIVTFNVSGIIDVQQHGSIFNVYNSEQLQVAFIDLCKLGKHYGKKVKK